MKHWKRLLQYEKEKKTPKNNVSLQTEHNRHVTNNKPMVTFTPVTKYALDPDERMHSGYTPAAAPLSLTDSVAELEFVNTELTIVDTTGVHSDPEDEITHA